MPQIDPRAHFQEDLGKVKAKLAAKQKAASQTPRRNHTQAAADNRSQAASNSRTAVRNIARGALNGELLEFRRAWAGGNQELFTDQQFPATSASLGIQATAAPVVPAADCWW